jgi:SAM-dependent methyltransferase
LDFGCGSGRDAKYFLDQGYTVEASDGSEELCKLASIYTGIPVRHLRFEELSEVQKYNGVWACASILHLPIEALKDVLIKIAAALKENGVLYTSFKYGEFEGFRNDRYFTDMTEEKFEELQTDIGGFTIAEQFVTTDVRPGRDGEKWLNLLLSRKDYPNNL